LPRITGRINPENFTPYPKNPILANFFVNIGRADALGSGVRNLYRFAKLYSGEEPELIEGDVFRTIVLLGTSSVESNRKNQTGDEIVEGVKTAQKTGDTTQKSPETTQKTDGTTQKSPETSQKTTGTTQKTDGTTQKIMFILEKIRKDPKISRVQLAKEMGISVDGVKWYFSKLKANGFIRHTGPDKGGYWEAIIDRDNRKQ
jgi:ATP-dependent DNA helicase RecG